MSKQKWVNDLIESKVSASISIKKFVKSLNFKSIVNFFKLENYLIFSIRVIAELSVILFLRK